MFVQVEGDVRRKTGHTSIGDDRRSRGDTADVDRTLAWAAAAGGDAGQLGEVVCEYVDVELFERVRADRVDGDRDILCAFRALCGGDRNRREARLGLLCGFGVLGQRSCWQ